MFDFERLLMPQLEVGGYKYTRTEYLYEKDGRTCRRYDGMKDRDPTSLKSIYVFLPTPPEGSEFYEYPTQESEGE